MQQGIYKITNRINRKIYIGSSINISKRLKEHLRCLLRNTHRNSKLQNAVNKYGIENFDFSVLSLQPNISRDDLLELEEFIINSYDRDILYNLQFQTDGGGADSLSKETYLLDLKGNIIKTYKSTNECYREFYKSQGRYDSLNMNAIVNKKYRIVTKEFYDSNIETIKSWEPFSSYTTVLKEYKDFLKPLQVTDTHTKEIFIFNTLLEVGDHIKVSAERVRQCLVSGELITKRYLISKLNKPEDFYAYKWLDLKLTRK